MKRVILKKRIYWWRFFFDTFNIRYTYPDRHAPHVVWVCRLMLPCADNYRPPKARNDNHDWWVGG